MDSIDEKIHQILTEANHSESDEESEPVAHIRGPKFEDPIRGPKFNAKQYYNSLYRGSDTENEPEVVPEVTKLRRDLRQRDKILNGITHRLRKLPQVNRQLEPENILEVIDDLISQLHDIQNTTREEFSHINDERDKERHELDELNRCLKLKISELEIQKQKMNFDLDTLHAENEKHKVELDRLKMVVREKIIETKNPKSHLDKEIQTLRVLPLNRSTYVEEGKALAQKDQFITWLKQDNEFLTDEKNKLTELVNQLEVHLENQHLRANRYKNRAEIAESKLHEFASSQEFKLMKNFNAYLSSSLH